MKTIRLKIDSEKDRESMILALAKSGYRVWVYEEIKPLCVSYYVCFEVSDKEVE